MKYIKKFEAKEIIYSVGDIVTLNVKFDEYNDYVGYIHQSGKFEYNKNRPVYGKDYKVLDIIFYGEYDHLYREHLYLAVVNIEDIETGKVFNHYKPYLFTKGKLEDEMMVGDYIIGEILDNTGSNGFRSFIKETVGRYVGINTTKEHDLMIEYRRVPENIEYYFYNNTNPFINRLGHIDLKIENIVYYSKDKSDVVKQLELINSTNNFNV